LERTKITNLQNPVKKILLALTVMSLLSVSALFAGETKECKKCAGDKDAKCTCCDKDKDSCPKSDKDAKPAPSTEKKS
jgi:hypothetical protein